MLYIKSLHIKPLHCILCLALLASCGKKESSIDIVRRGCTVKSALNYDSTAVENNGKCIYPPQGPKNGSFEVGSSKDADYWKRAGNNNGSSIFLDNYCKWLNGSQQATNGSDCFYLSVNKYYCSMSEISQGDINLAETKELLFDYVMEVSVNTDAELEILFSTTAGTVTLKSLVINSSQSVRDEKITIPNILEPGRLTFRLKNYQSSEYFTRAFIDNIRAVLK